MTIETKDPDSYAQMYYICICYPTLPSRVLCSYFDRWLFCIVNKKNLFDGLAMLA